MIFIHFIKKHNSERIELKVLIINDTINFDYLKCEDTVNIQFK
jgi:hypothetical protein